MDIKQITCGCCNGRGWVEVWKIVSRDENTGIGTAQIEETTCGNCNGKGYTEYPVFSVEEARVILKHCGLSTEN